LLGKRGAELTKNQYHTIRKTLDILNAVIHYYDDFKAETFNFRKMINFMTDYQNSIKQVERVKTSSDPEIAGIQQSLRVALFYACLTYTPFIKSEMLFRLILELSKILVKTGAKKCEEAFQCLLWIKKEKDSLSLSGNQQAARC